MLTPEMISAIVGIVLFLIIQLSKYTKLAPEVVIITSAIVTGILYTLYSYLLPIELQQHVIAFVSTAFATSWTLYVIIYKGYKAIYGNVKVNDVTGNI